MAAEEEHAFLSTLLATIMERLSVLEGAGGGGATGTGSAPQMVQAQVPKSLRLYDAYLTATLDPFVAAATALGGPAAELGAVVKEGWTAQRDFLAMATCVKAPKEPQVVAKLAPVQAAIQKAKQLIQRNDFENHAKAVAEGMQALTWVVVRPAPTEYIENFVGASDFWGNKVRIQHKKTAPEHVAFVDTFKKMILELMGYVKECHTIGVAWNTQGVEMEAYVPGMPVPGLPQMAVPMGSPKPAGMVPAGSKSLRAYDAYLRSALDPFVAAAKDLGGPAAELGSVVQEAWTAQRELLVMAGAVKAPGKDDKLVPKLAPVQGAIGKAKQLIQRNDFENHAKAVAEGMQALTWVVVRPAPAEYIENFVGASDFWGNKVRIQHKKTEPKHVVFVDTFKKLIVELMAYVKDCHTTGVTWNPQGVDIDAYVPGAAALAAPVLAPAPAPVVKATPSPPAPPAPTPAVRSPPRTYGSSGGSPPRAHGGVAPPSASEPGGRAGLFSQLGKGLSITSGLKKVSKEQQTWRPEYKEQQGGGGSAAPPPPPPSASTSGGVALVGKKAFGPGAVAKKKEPKSSYEAAQFRWNVEHYTEGVHKVEVGDLKQSVYIYGCGAAVIDVRGKGKSVTLDGCKRTQVVMDEMLSSLEVVNCQGVKVQVRQKVPTVAIDKTDGILVILSQASLGASFITSKSSEMNVQYPKNEEGEMAERPIPEQWQHTLEGEWPDLRVKNEVSALYTH